jgi:hypothetical protein
VYIVEARVVWVNPEEGAESEVAFGAKYVERNPTLISHLISDYVAKK